MSNIYFMPCEGRNIQLSDIERSEDKNLIHNLLKLGMLVLVFCSVEDRDENEPLITVISAYKNASQADDALNEHSYEDYYVWTELISPIPFEDWNYEWDWH